MVNTIWVGAFASCPKTKARIKQTFLLAILRYVLRGHHYSVVVLAAAPTGAEASTPASPEHVAVAPACVHAACAPGERRRVTSAIVHIPIFKL